MKLESYRLLLKIVVAAIGLVVAFGIALNNLLLPLAGVTAGMLVLFGARRSVQETSSDERTVLIQQKAAQATLSVTVAGTAFVGLGLMLLSRQGILGYEQQGYQLAILSLLVMSVKAFFDWYYRDHLGG